MGSTPGVYRATYKDRHGELREASTWIASYWDASLGKRVKEYGFESAAAAKRRRAEIMAGPKASGSSALTLGAIVALVLADYEMHARKSLRAVQSKATLLRDSMGAGRLLRNIDDEGITAHVRRLQAQGYRPATINRTLALLKRGLRLASRSHPGIAIPHIPMLSEADNVRQGFLEPEVLAAILAHLPAPAARMVRALHITGWRVSEIESRRWLDLEGGYLLLRPGETKNGRGRAYPLEPDLSRIIGPKPAGALPTDSIFNVTHDSLGNLWQDARAKAGHPGALLHDLRRTAARDLIKSGVDRDTAKRLIGHETDSIFTRYRIVVGDDLADAAQKLSDFRNIPKSPPPKKAATRTGLGTIGVPTTPSKRKQGTIQPMKRKALAS